MLKQQESIRKSILCATVSQPIYCRTEPTCGLFRSFWDTATYVLRKYIRMWIRTIFSRHLKKHIKKIINLF